MLRNFLKMRFKHSQGSKKISLEKTIQRENLQLEYNKALQYLSILRTGVENENPYVDAYWNTLSNKALEIYSSQEKFSQFGQNDVVIATMIGDPVRNNKRRFDDLIKYDEEPLLLEDWIGNFRLNIPSLVTSSQRLAHIYIANLLCEILPDSGTHHYTISEIGGGFGGLARVLCSKINVENYRIIDLYQFLPLQRAYLNLCLEKPLTSFDYISVKNNFTVEPSDIFISNWALTESTALMQQHILENKFFGAKHVFIACQNNNKNHKDSKFIHSYLEANASINMVLKGTLTDSKLYYLDNG